MKRSRIAVIAVIVLALAGLACALVSGRSDLPEERPADVTISYSVSAGMLPEGTSMVLSSGGGSFTQHRGQIKHEFAFDVKPADLDALYRVLRENRVDKIRTDPGIVYDKGGSSIGLGWNQGAKWVTIGDGGAEISARWQSEWRAVNAALGEFARKQVDARKVELAVTIDPSIRERSFTLSAGGATLVDRLSKSDPASERVTVGVLPGSQAIEVNLLKSGLPSDRAYLRPSSDFVWFVKSIDVSASTSLVLSVDGDVVRLEPK
jgi:hypothetical protein